MDVCGASTAAALDNAHYKQQLLDVYLDRAALSQ
jgi:hypothetical protein